MNVKDLLMCLCLYFCR